MESVSRTRFSLPSIHFTHILRWIRRKRERFRPINVMVDTRSRSTPSAARRNSGRVAEHSGRKGGGQQQQDAPAGDIHRQQQDADGAPAEEEGGEGEVDAVEKIRIAHERHVRGDYDPDQVRRDLEGRLL